MCLCASEQGREGGEKKTRGEISGKDDASREEIAEKQKQRGGKKSVEGELKQIIYLSGINREACRMERI